MNPYLNFNGNCMEAFEFYKSVFGGEFTYVGKYKDMPMEDGKQMPEELKELIMHIGLPINEQTTLCGSDVSETFGQKAVIGGNIALMISLNSKEEVDALWEKLSDGATIGMPPEVAFWGDYFGDLTDKFGTSWMLICSDRIVIQYIIAQSLSSLNTEVQAKGEGYAQNDATISFGIWMLSSMGANCIRHFEEQ
jgi:PhnB protein